MGRNIKKLWNAVFVAVEFWAICGFFYAWLSGDAVVLGSYHVSPALAMQTYAALGVGAGVFLFLWNRDNFVQWRQRRNARRPEVAFRRLYGAITQQFNIIEQDGEYPHTLSRSQASKYAQRKMLRFELLACGVETPDPASDGDQIWYEFIANLVPLSLHSRLEEAKTLGSRYSTS